MRRFIFLSALFLLFCLTATLAQQQGNGLQPGGASTVGTTFLPPPPALPARYTPATFQITYVDNPDDPVNGIWTPALKTAFERAASYWAGLFYSPVPITIKAAFRDVGRSFAN